MGVKIQDPSFYGADPIAQPSSIASVATTAITTAAITTTTNAYGFATTTQANDIAAVCAANRTAVNSILAALRTLKLIAT